MPLGNDLLKNKANEHLLQLSETADLTKSAWTLLKQWQVDLDHPAFHSAEDFRQSRGRARAEQRISRGSAHTGTSQIQVQKRDRRLARQREIDVPRMVSVEASQCGRGIRNGRPAGNPTIVAREAG